MPSDERFQPRVDEDEVTHFLKIEKPTYKTDRGKYSCEIDKVTTTGYLDVEGKLISRKFSLWFFFLCLFVFLHEISVFKTSFQEVQVNKSNSGHIQIPTHSVENRKKKSLYTRNFYKEIVRVNCRNFHTVLHNMIRYQILLYLYKSLTVYYPYHTYIKYHFLRLFSASLFFSFWRKFELEAACPMKCNTFFLWYVG